MVESEILAEFIRQKVLAIVGVSRSGDKFSNKAFRDLTKKGYMVYPVNPFADMIENTKCYPGLNALPEKVNGVVIFVPPEKTLGVVKDAHAAGIERVWMQEGAESPDAIKYCEQNGIKVIYDECIMVHSRSIKFI